SARIEARNNLGRRVKLESRQGKARCTTIEHRLDRMAPSRSKAASAVEGPDGCVDANVAARIRARSREEAVVRDEGRGSAPACALVLGKELTQARQKPDRFSGARAMSDFYAVVHAQ